MAISGFIIGTSDELNFWALSTVRSGMVGKELRNGMTSGSKEGLSEADIVKEWRVFAASKIILEEVHCVYRYIIMWEQILYEEIPRWYKGWCTLANKLPRY
jgi:hypothetical protein